MSAEPASPGPRLVYDATSDPARSAPVRRSDRRPWLLILLAGFALLALFEWRRAAALEGRVVALSAHLATAEAEIAARQSQLGAIRASVADVRERVAGLASLAAEEPVVPPAPPAETPPAH